MLKELFWDTFKNSGNIEAYIFFKELDEYNKSSNENKTVENIKTEIS
jgi:hypothetical protein